MYSVKDEVIRISNELNIPGKNNILQSMFLDMLPDDYNFVQMVHDPYCWINQEFNKPYYFYGYYLPEISRDRAFARLNRRGKNIFFGDTYEFLLSILGDDTYRGALASAPYFDGNGLDLPDKYLKTVDRWDYYIKPIIYGKYWGDTLTYFPKYQGFEKIDYLHGNPLFRKHAVITPYTEVVDILSTPGASKRFYENVIYTAP